MRQRERERGKARREREEGKRGKEREREEGKREGEKGEGNILPVFVTRNVHKNASTFVTSFVPCLY